MLTINSQILLIKPLIQLSGCPILKTFQIQSCLIKTPIYCIYQIHDPQTNIPLTLKVLSKAQNLNKDKIINEIKNHQMFLGRHNIMELREVYQDNNSVYLVMERWGRTLGDILKCRKVLTEYQAQLVFSQLVDLIVELRTKNIAHNAISLDSIFVDLNQKHKLKLGEFSRSYNISQLLTRQQHPSPYLPTLTFLNLLSQPISTSTPPHHSQTQLPQTIHKNLLYSSPQQDDLWRSTYSVAGFNQKDIGYLEKEGKRVVNVLFQNDLWMIGIVMFRLLVGRFPFSNEYDQNCQEESLMQYDTWYQKLNHNNQTSNLKLCSYNFTRLSPDYIQFQSISSQFKHLISSLLKPINQRIKLKDLLNHPLKLQNYYNVRDIDFMSDLPPLINANVPVLRQLRPLKQELRYEVGEMLKQIKFQNARQTNGQRQDDMDQSSKIERKKKISQLKQFNKIQSQRKRQNLNYLIPTSNNLTAFSLYNQQPSYSCLQLISPFSGFNSQKFQYMWDLNFNQQDLNLQKKNQNQNISIPSIVSKNQIKYQKRTQRIDQQPLSNQKYKEKKNKDLEQKENIINQNSNTVSKKISLHNILSSNSNQSVALINNLADTGNPPFRKTATSNSIFTIRSINNSIHAFKDERQKGVLKRNKDPSLVLTGSQNVRFLASTMVKPSTIQGSEVNLQKSEKKFLVTSKLQKLASRKYVAPTPNQSTSSFINNQSPTQNLLIQSYFLQIPFINQAPEFILQYKYKRGQNILGYVVNNIIGVVFGRINIHVIGNNQRDYGFVHQQQANNRIVYFNKNHKQHKNHNQTKSHNQQKHHNQRKSHNQHTHTTIYQHRTFNQHRTNTSSNKFQIFQQYHHIYVAFLKTFGKRMLKSDMSVWVQRFWSQGKIFIFLLNNGCWQVTFQGKKTSKFYMIDQNQLVWCKGTNLQNDMVNQVRSIVKKKRDQLIREKYYLTNSY